jgi:hypothetical protein
LILGGVLIALLLLTDPSLSEVSGRYGDAEFKVVRGRFLNAAHLIRTAAGALDAETRLQLDPDVLSLEARNTWSVAGY